MKGGNTPIHVQRWCPADYQVDEHVRLLYARRDWRTLTFYRTFLDVAFMQGGDLPAEPEALAACVRMPLADVRKALGYCLNRLVHEDRGRLYQGRLRRDVKAELEFREIQRTRANMRWHPDGNASALPQQNVRQSPPSPSPAPITDTPLPPAGGGPVENPEAHGNGNGRPPGVRAQRAEQTHRLLRIWTRILPEHLHGDIPLDARDRISKALRDGKAFWQVAGSISEMARDTLRAAGELEAVATWPPEGWLDETETGAETNPEA